MLNNNEYNVILELIVERLRSNPVCLERLARIYSLVVVANKYNDIRFVNLALNLAHNEENN